MIQASELDIKTVAEGTQAEEMAAAIFGEGVQIFGASYTGDDRSAGLYSGGDATSDALTPGDTGVIFSTGQAEDVTNSSGEANQRGNTTTNTSGPTNEADFDTAAGRTTDDASFIDVDFIPDGDEMAMQFVFASEEYPQFFTSIYQDFVGVWINGTQVKLGIGDGSATPGNIGPSSNANFYIDNGGDTVNTEMNGLTLTLSLTIPVNKDVLNSIRIGIADVADNRFDSNVLIAANSLQTRLVARDDAANIYPNGVKRLDVLENDEFASGAILTITHINGVAVVPGDVVTLPSGQTVELNDDGTLTLSALGIGGPFGFTYAVSDGVTSDTGIVNMSSIPCFVTGTRIETPDGPRRVETLRPGDLVLTKDRGAQPLCWVGERTVAAEGRFAPIEIRANALGRHGRLMFSPEHRVVLRDYLAELLFGEEEVLVAAKHLVNDHSIRRRVGGLVTYVHLMFDQHEVVFAEGLATESFQPGPQTPCAFERAVLDEICALFPQFDPDTGEGYGPAARRTLRRHEATLWSQGARVA